MFDLNATNGGVALILYNNIINNKEFINILKNNKRLLFFEVSKNLIIVITITRKLRNFDEN